MKRVSIVVPCYNEKETITIFYNAIINLWKQLQKYELEIVFVDDGSRDNSFEIMSKLYEEDNRVKCISFSKNFGKEAAIFSGLHQASGDCVIVMDVDLQHPPSKIPEMLEKWEQGNEIVEGIKVSRGKESIFYKLCVNVFYIILSRLIGFDMRSSSDYKLLDRKVVDTLGQMKESNTFFRALSHWVGYDSIAVFYEVQGRTAGTTKWSTKALFGYAIKNLISFTYIPLYLIIMIGLAVMAVGAGLSIDALISYFQGRAVGGYPSLVILVILTTGGIMSSLGIMAIYLAKIYEEIKGRPRYIISKKKE